MIYLIPSGAILQIVPEPALVEARVVGIARVNYVFDNDLKNYGDPKTQSEQMANHIRATRTERALEHYTGLPWHRSVGVLGGPDVGDNLQVRSKPYPPGGDLMFRPGLDKHGRQLDKDDDAFVLVWDCGSDWFWLIGWLWGVECRAAPAKLHAGGYKYIRPPYRDVATLIDKLNRPPSTWPRVPSSASAAEHLWD